MGLARFIFKRLVFTVITLIVLTLLLFATTTLFPPADRAAMFVPPNVKNIEQIDLMEIAREHHFDDPFYIQYLDWLSEAVIQGRLGYSPTYRAYVLDVILRSFPPTIELVVFAAPVIILVGIELGTYSAKRAYRKKGRDDPVDSVVRVFTTLGYSTPLFLIGLLSVSIFFLHLHWFAPVRLGSAAEMIVTSQSWKGYTGMYIIDGFLNGQSWVSLEALRQLVLPTAILIVSLLPIVVKVTRSSVLVEFNNSYVTAARAKGLKDVEVVNRVRRNAMIPVLTISSIILGNMLTGIVVLEYVFSRRGLGYLAIDAAKNLDFALLAGLSVFFCFAFVTINLLVDILYTYFDPRVRL